MSGTRFSGRGSLWKTSWRRRPLLQEMPCFSGFSTQATGQYYLDAGGALDISPVAGWFLGAVVSIAQIPAVSEPIARNGNNANEGWELDIVNTGSSQSVDIRLTVYDGAGVAAQVSTPVSLENVGTVFDQVLVTVLGVFVPPTGGNPNGSIAINGSAETALASPYLNAAPRLTVGVGSGIDALKNPNCLLGMVGGTAPWTSSSSLSWNQTRDDWQDLIRDQQTIVPVPSTFEPSLVNTDGWRPPPDLPPGSAEPNPLAPFVGATSLVYGNGIGGPLLQRWVSSEVFSPENAAAF